MKGVNFIQASPKLSLRTVVYSVEPEPTAIQDCRICYSHLISGKTNKKVMEVKKEIVSKQIALKNKTPATRAEVKRREIPSRGLSRNVFKARVSLVS